MERSNPVVVEAAKRPHEVMAEVKKPGEVLAMSLKDSLKFGILIGKVLFVHLFLLLSLSVSVSVSVSLSFSLSLSLSLFLSPTCYFQS